MRTKTFLIWSSLALSWIGCKESATLLEPIEVKKAGIDFENTLTDSDSLSILDYLYFYNGGGVALGDIDNDGLTDLFFTGNKVPNKLYRNLGDFRFENITEKAGILHRQSWSTGVTMGDVNGDGLLDIYVCAVTGIHGFTGGNELYINKGNGSFSEEATSWGVNLETYASSAAFLDYDLDGDLDLYVLNHAVHTPESYGSASLRNRRDSNTGDRLFRNDGDHFTDVSEEAGIYGGINGFGLGICVTDVNQDGYPDIYISNDFHEDDYLYINQQDGSFSERGKEMLMHTSRFSMGVDAADINHDGLPDIMTLDMLPWDDEILRSTEGDDNVQMQQLRTGRLGYRFQFTRNMLQLNQGGTTFSETALLSGIAATDWSWNTLMTDFDLDGETDIFISNGIPKRPNDLDYVKFLSNEEIRKELNAGKKIDRKALEIMPEGSVPNKIFKGNGDLTFSDQTGLWIPEINGNSNGAALADLDNDGDPDLVTNNLNDTPSIYRNQSAETGKKGMTLRLRQPGSNPFAVGARLWLWSEGRVQYRELYPSEGFQSASAPEVWFGLGQASQADSLVIAWPDSSVYSYKNLTSGSVHLLRPDGAKSMIPQRKNTESIRFMTAQLTDSLFPTHKEDSHLDFNVHKLIPYRISDRGPALASGDLDGDGITDLFMGNARGSASILLKGTEGGFKPWQEDLMEAQKLQEITAALMVDVNGDGKDEMISGAGGGHFFGKAVALTDQIWHLNGDSLLQQSFEDNFEHTSVLAANNPIAKGIRYLFAGAFVKAEDFGAQPLSSLWTWEDGSWKQNIQSDLSALGHVTDATWTDLDGDGLEELIVVGEWMSPMIGKQTTEGIVFGKISTDALSGLWQAVHPFDIDQDGDMDLLLGNWGTNTRFTANAVHPLKLYSADFDRNDRSETITAVYREGRYVPLETYDELAAQLPTLIRKKFPDYRSMAQSSLEEIFSREALENATQMEVSELQSGYLENHNGQFTFVPFDNRLQTAPITSFCTIPSGEQTKAVVVAGNYFGVKPYHGRPDSFSGALLRSANNVTLTHELGLDLSGKAITDLEYFQFEGQHYLWIGINNQPSQFIKILIP